VVAAGDDDGFEGNAQSFRILTKLAVRFDECEGLDLTRATLSASLKYPWMKDPNHAIRKSKYGVYAAEQDDFAFARAGCDPDSRTAEAELMDWSDDIAYSVHDLEDITKCGAVPWERIFRDREELVERAHQAWPDAPADARDRLRDAHDSLAELFMQSASQLISQPYEATRAQRAQVRMITSTLIGRYVRAIRLAGAGAHRAGISPVEIGEDEQYEVRILKQATRDYVVQNRALAAQREGHGRILKELFEDLMNDIDDQRNSWYFPKKFEHFIRDHGVSKARIVADCLASLREREVFSLHGRLHGYSSGSVLDPIVR
jgi:dGTPase